VKAFGAVSNAWTESGTGGITWNNAPATTSATPLATTTVTGTTSAYYDWDVTAFVRPQIQAGASQVTLVLVGDTPLFQANSREAATNRPQLVLQ
jgi:hypothetical protein